MSDQITDRAAKLEKLRALGIDPYAGRFPNTTAHAEIHAGGSGL
jgi:hypothetical protein